MRQEEFISRFSNKWSNTFDQSLKNIRRNDDIAKFIDEVCRECSSNLPKNVIYLGYTFEDSIDSTNELSGSTTGIKNLKKNVIPIHCKDTYARLAIFSFEMKLETMKKNNEKMVETSLVKMPIWIPLLIDDYHYLIKGGKYSAPLQIIDKIIYANQSDNIILKTMTRPIKMAKSKGTNITDIYGVKYITQSFHIHMSKKKIPFLLFYLAYYGFEGTLDFFGAKDHIKLVNIKNINLISEELNEKFIYFKFGQFYLQVDKEGFKNNLQVRQFVACLLIISKKSMDLEYLSRIERWQTLLGSYINDSNAMEKGIGLVNTFINALDFRTRQLIKDLMPDGDKRQDTFHVVRWMFSDFSNLASKKTTDMTNKRIRLGEYLIAPITKNMQHKIYRFMNINNKNRSIKHLEDISKISSHILLFSIIGKITKKDLAINIMNFSSYVNDNGLLNAGLRATFGGPGSPGQNSGKHISTDYRQFDESFVGRICTTYSSNSDPGISVMILPKGIKIDHKTMTFMED